MSDPTRRPQRAWYRRPRYAATAAALLVAAAAGAAVLTNGDGGKAPATASTPTAEQWILPSGDTSTPIKHVVVIFGENISFDHYFGTYPNATNEDGTPFHPVGNTPKVNGLTEKLLTDNPNAYNPKRLSPEHALTCDQGHSYQPQQKAFNGGKMDKFVENTEKSTCTGQPILFGEPGISMEYFDGNTVTAYWNYAQHFATSDNSYGSNFGPSSPGAINLISGNTHGIYAVDSVTHKKVTDAGVVQSPDANGIGTMINDPDPAFDDCSDSNHTSTNALGVMTGKNVGDLLNAKHVTWGWFEGGFRPTGHANGYAVCGTTHQNVGGNEVVDYSPHHQPFQYYKSTANPKHLPPSSIAAVGRTDQANHQYDVADFDAALHDGVMPAVSFLKAPSYQDGHAGYSDPIDEQHFLVNQINAVQQSKFWKSTAIVLAYDDSDGWYDHQKAPLVNGSQDAAVDEPMCQGTKAIKGYNDRCGYGPRLPLVVISPFSKQNYVSHALSDQTSVTTLIEQNWGLGQIGDGSYDARAGSLLGRQSVFDFRHPHFDQVLLRPDGSVKR